MTIKTLLENLITSRAHEDVEQNFTKDKYVCLRCGKRGGIETMFSDAPNERCTPHFELKTSGWKDEPDCGRLI
jgi:hypothetical protein